MTSHFVEWTLGPDETDISIEFEMTYSGAPMVMPSLNYPGDPPEPPEFELVAAHTLKTDEEIKPGHALWGALEETFGGDETLFEKMANIAQSYVNDEDF